MDLNGANGDIRLTWFGHSCFKIEIDEKSLFLDPVRRNALLGTTLEPLKERRVSAILVSHDHWDHYDAETIMALAPANTSIYCPRSVANSLSHRMTFDVNDINELEKLQERLIIVKKGDIIKINEVTVKCLEASEGLSFLMLGIDKKILFMGDSVATNEMIKEKPDVVLFPVWAVRGEEAKLEEFLELAMVSQCIPMHYHTSQEALPNFYIPPQNIQELLPSNMNVKILEKDRPYKI